MGCLDNHGVVGLGTQGLGVGGMICMSRHEPFPRPACLICQPAMFVLSPTVTRTHLVIGEGVVRGVERRENRGGRSREV